MSQLFFDHMTECLLPPGKIWIGPGPERPAGSEEINIGANRIYAGICGRVGTRVADEFMLLIPHLSAKGPLRTGLGGHPVRVVACEPLIQNLYAEDRGVVAAIVEGDPLHVR